jgi:dephospho-CoA kinase
MRKNVIYLMGPMGSGKGTAAQFLKSRGYTVFSLSQVVRERTEEAGLSPTTENLQKFGGHLKITYGEDYFARMMVERMKEDPNRDIVIDGPRSKAEIECIIEQFSDVLLLYIHVATPIREQRIIQRSRLGDPADLDQLRLIMTKDLDWLNCCKQIEGIIVVDNNDTLEGFYDRLVERIHSRLQIEN